MRCVVVLPALLLALILPAVGVRAQEPTATPPVDERHMTREERIKLHQARIDRIIKENERRRQEDARKAAEAKARGAQPGQPPAGTPMPAVPVVTYTPQKGQVTPPPQAAPPKGARAEARSIFYFKPYDSVVNLGDTFQTELVADTKDGSVDTISVLIHYPTRVLNPLALDHAEMDRFVKSEFEYSFDPDAGEIYVRAPFKEPTKLVTQPLFTIVWEAIGQTSGADVELISQGNRKTAMLLRGVNVLGTSPMPDDGVINTTVMVRNPKARPFVQKQPDSGILVGTSQIERPEPAMELNLRSSKEFVKQGDVFHVDVKIINPDEKPFDHIRLLMKFDPKDFEVVDWDYGNWIRSGINAQDGFAHETMPFDFLKANEADNKRGTLVYEAATETQPLYSEGPVIKVRFRALRTTDNAEITLIGGPNASDISYLRQSVLEDNPTHAAVLDQVSLVVEKPLPKVATLRSPAESRGSAIVVGSRGRPAGGL